MKIQYLGTAAAEGIPGIFCACPTCVEAREKGGRYVRTRSQLMLDDILLVDFGPDTYMHSLLYGIDLSRIAHVFITHAHMDHLYPLDFQMRRVGYSHNVAHDTLTVHGSPDIKETSEAVWAAQAGGWQNVIESGRVAFDIMSPYEERKADGFTVTALPASHGTKNPYVYLFEKEGKCFLMHNDSGYLKPEAMEWLRKNNKKFDLVSYECTHGGDDCSIGYAGNIHHLGLPNALEERRRFIENGNYKDNTVDVITHFSHNGPFVGYGDMLKLAEREGIILAYDGMTVEI